MDSALRVFAVDIDGTLTENGGGAIHLGALSKLRYLERLGHKVVYVTGRSSIEAYVLAVFGGTTKVAVGENGGAITVAPQDHKLLASKEKCEAGYQLLKKSLDGVQIKPVFPRMTEVVLLRTFDLAEAQRILDENHLDLYMSDSKYAFHINEKGVDKGFGLKSALELLDAEQERTIAIGDSETDIPMFRECGVSIALGHSEKPVKDAATHVVSGGAGHGLVEAIDYVALKYLGASTLKQENAAPT
ncbi:MAG: phosphoglycolate phosphatase [Nitrososphaera sp.]